MMMTNEKALQRFIQLRNDAHAKAEAILAHVENHCDIAPDDISWGSVGDIAHILELLTLIDNFITGEGD